MIELQKMLRLGIINLGLNKEESENFKRKLEELVGSSCMQSINDFHYRQIDPTKIAESCDTLILSHGTEARVGLLNYKQAQKDPHLGPLYNLIHTAVDEGVPLLGVNAGHEALNGAYNWAIFEINDPQIPKDMKKGYHQETRLNSDKVINPETKKLDPIAQDVGDIVMQLTNNWAVLPKDKQKKRYAQKKIKPLAHYKGWVLISKVDSESGAPIYGVQFNLQPGTKKIFQNFFYLAQQYLEKK
jgi:hypothetical protein